MSPSSAIRSSRAAAIVLVATLGSACGSTTAVIPVPSAAQVPGCVTPEAAEFNFWVGTWQGTWTDNQGTASASDIVVKTGCELDETFTARRFLGHSDYHAMSHSHWDHVLVKWVQDYSDSVGERSRWLGGFADGAMTLIGPQVGSRQQRVLWRNISTDGWIWEYDSSADGASWGALLLVTYTRVK